MVCQSIIGWDVKERKTVLLTRFSDAVFAAVRGGGNSNRRRRLGQKIAGRFNSCKTILSGHSEKLARRSVCDHKGCILACEWRSLPWTANLFLVVNDTNLLVVGLIMPIIIVVAGRSMVGEVQHRRSGYRRHCYTFSHRLPRSGGMLSNDVTMMREKKW